MKKSLVLILAVVLAFSGGLFANGLSLNSIGPKALGMGGAFVGVANDLTAIYWNPAGLTQVQGTNVMVFGTDIIPMGTYKFDMAGIDASMNKNHYISPNLFANYTVDNWSFGLGVYVPAGLGSEWDPADFGLPGSFELMSKIAVVNIAPTVAYKVSDQFSLGLAVNIYYGMFDMKRPVQVSPTAFAQYEEESNGTGYGATLGLKYDVNDQWALGATVRLKTTVKMSGTAKNPAFAAYGAPESDFDRDVAWPLWISGGIAYKPTERLTLALDAQYSKWSDLKELETKYTNDIWAANIPAEDANMTLKWKDATQIRFGAQYMANENLPLRVGYYYDPAPAPDETVNVLFPSSTNHVITGGIGYKSGQMMFDFGMEYLLGAERDISIADNGDFPGKHQLDIFAFSLGLGYAF